MAGDMVSRFRLIVLPENKLHLPFIHHVIEEFLDNDDIIPEVIVSQSENVRILVPQGQSTSR